MCYNLSVIVSFADQATEDIFDGTNSKTARKACPPQLWNIARRKLDALNQAAALQDLRAPPGNRLELLKGNRTGQHSIRINNQYRICFTWTQEGPANVEITDCH
jgi:proteic killer suppression protein